MHTTIYSYVWTTSVLNASGSLLAGEGITIHMIQDYATFVKQLSLDTTKRMTHLYIDDLLPLILKAFQHCPLTA